MLKKHLASRWALFKTLILLFSFYKGKIWHESINMLKTLFVCLSFVLKQTKILLLMFKPSFPISGYYFCILHKLKSYNRALAVRIHYFVFMHNFRVHLQSAVREMWTPVWAFSIKTHWCTKSNTQLVVTEWEGELKKMVLNCFTWKLNQFPVFVHFIRVYLLFQCTVGSCGRTRVDVELVLVLECLELVCVAGDEDVDV